MNIVINNNEFDQNNILLKNNDKILYNFHNIQLLGIPLIIKDFDYDIIENYIKIKCKNKDNITLLKIIDEYFNSKYKNYKNILNSDDIIFIKNVTNKKTIQKEIYININSLKREDFIFYLNIFTL
tara:strand:- start:155 stop:529 length:375 start_codon:yes stop_codon:yes gene_type:complete